MGQIANQMVAEWCHRMIQKVKDREKEKEKQKKGGKADSEKPDSKGLK